MKVAGTTVVVKDRTAALGDGGGGVVSLAGDGGGDGGLDPVGVGAPEGVGGMVEGAGVLAGGLTGAGVDVVMGTGGGQLDGGRAGCGDGDWVSDGAWAGVADCKRLLGSPAGVSGGTVRRDGPAQGVSDDMSRLRHGGLYLDGCNHHRDHHEHRHA
ncbi:hypothetical protein E3N88_05939 [Mikania micrantha]|uniref:Uncharacterized protein n=1 Tax=Mikania micrantha TaxID=192012 RepID=A0A5N6PMD3_9ASTR|nr:hypothetical protein E3N88_05939 [Mikania micrantha]